jgi:hypothetical protein
MKNQIQRTMMKVAVVTRRIYILQHRADLAEEKE